VVAHLWLFATREQELDHAGRAVPRRGREQADAPDAMRVQKAPRVGAIPMCSRSSDRSRSTAEATRATRLPCSHRRDPRRRAVIFSHREPRCYSASIQERAVLSNALSEKDLARLTREWAYFDSRTIAPHD
jgi:hypothetical protein